MARHKYDNQIEGQMSLSDLFEPPERLFAVSNIFARARKHMSLAEQKTFVYALSQLKFSEDAKGNVVYLEKKTLAEILGIHSDTNHLSVDLFDEIKSLPEHSLIKIADEDMGFYDSGVMITRVAMLKNRVRIKFEDEYLKLFTGLTKNYITMWSADIFGMNSKRSVQFYEFLRQKTDTRQEVNCYGLGIQALKEMFDIPKDGKGSYMRENGGFDRTNFEKYVIEPLCEDLMKTKMITLVLQEDGKPYKKVKKGNRVSGYDFFWTYSARPAVAAAEEVREIQERVDKDPAVLKVAKDIIKGEKKPKQRKKNGFNDFQQREYDFDALEKALLSNK